jgi:glyoxalase-like protein
MLASVGLDLGGCVAEDLRLDRVAIGAKDLDATAAWLGSVAGLSATEQWWFASGLSSRLAYSGGAAIEIIGQAFPGAEMVHPLTGQIYARTIAHDCWLTWVVVSSDIDATATRLGLDVMDVQATSSTGQTIAWRMAGAPEAFFSEPYLPYFVSYVDGDDAWRERALAPEPKFDVHRIEVSGDAERLSQWLGGADLPVELVPGSPALRSVVLSTPDGDLELQPVR